ncbi:hypothetical protein PPN31114_02654 [Pandoraea pneumonica]|jgi:hypothetical protein|uniref:Uncharacterized protein n=1 Tax=Pandoraea pneumonica TaxID=2508299 RepID=A0A5E4VG92_9BURK|nr:hypothetical protein [Pandoraea pneumonica]VVE11242.1 hypothetical protein PPN31114_02654 [Pandoraea pneumonica]
MFSISNRIAQTASNGVRQLGQQPQKHDLLNYVARREDDALVECRNGRELRHLLDVVGTPHAALTLNAILDTGMHAEGAVDLRERLASCRDGEIERRIKAVPTLQHWASDATWQLPSESHNRSLMLSLRVLQLFGHSTSVPVVFDPENRRVVFHYVGGNAPDADGQGRSDSNDASSNDRLRVLLHDAADGRSPNDPIHRASLNALTLLVSANDIDGLHTRSTHWQRHWDRWRHGNDNVRTLSLRLTPEFESWLEARTETAVSHSQDYALRQRLTEQARNPDDVVEISSTASSDPAPSHRPAHPDA